MAAFSSPLPPTSAPPPSSSASFFDDFFGPPPPVASTPSPASTPLRVEAVVRETLNVNFKDKVLARKMCLGEVYIRLAQGTPPPLTAVAVMIRLKLEAEDQAKPGDGVTVAPDGGYVVRVAPGEWGGHGKLAARFRSLSFKSPPIRAVPSWQMLGELALLTVEYSVNPTLKGLSFSDVQFGVALDAAPAKVESKPTALWSAETKKVVWKVPNPAAMAMQGKLMARYVGPLQKGSVRLALAGGGGSCSGVGVEVVRTVEAEGTVVWQFVSGEYVGESA
jgi:hypothetical protein